MSDKKYGYTVVGVIIFLLVCLVASVLCVVLNFFQWATIPAHIWLSIMGIPTVVVLFVTALLSLFRIIKKTPPQ